MKRFVATLTKAKTPRGGRSRFYRTIHEIADKRRPKVKRLIVEGFMRLRDGTSLKAIADAVESRNVNDILAVLGFPPGAAPKVIDTVMGPVFEELRGIYERAGIATAGAFPKQPILKFEGTAAMAFDLLNPEAIAHLKRYRFDLIRGIDAKTREGIREILIAGFQEGLAPFAMARRIKEMIGLTAFQAKAVSNYRRALQTSSTASLNQALARATRDRRFDPSVLTALETGGALRADQVERMTRRFAERALAARATNIARTETINAANQGQMRLWEQAVQEGRLDQRIARVHWIVTPDDRLAVVSGKTKVMTINGWVAISKIRPGDRVLTHKDRFCEVVSIDKRHFNGPVVNIKMAGRAGHSVTVTHEHEVLVYRDGSDQWIEAKDLHDDDEFYINAKPCADCGKLIPSGYRVKTALCKSCSSLRSNKSRWSTIEARVKARESNLRRWAKPGAREAQSIRFRALLDERGDEMIAKGLRNRGRNRFGHSYLERKMKWFLDKQGITFEAQKFFTYDRAGKRTRSWADFYIPGRDLVIECDGPTHSEPETAARDNDRDAALRERGIEILRFTDHEIRAEFPMVADAIRVRCCLMRKRAKKITRYDTNHQPCYDLQVAEDESFVAGGIVVHNCPICRPIPSLNPEGVPVGQTFITPVGPRRAPTAHPQCRCALGVDPDGIERSVSPPEPPKGRRLGIRNRRIVNRGRAA